MIAMILIPTTAILTCVAALQRKQKRHKAGSQRKKQINNGDESHPHRVSKLCGTRQRLIKNLQPLKLTE
jgi:hypothetical protein